MKSYQSTDTDFMTSASSNTSPRTKPSGVLAVFGCFFVVCAIFVFIAFVFDAISDISQAGWPVVSAVLERRSVEEYHPFRRDGGGITWHIACRVRYEASGSMRTVTLRTRSTRTDGERAQLNAWTAAHQPGSTIQIRYDPADPEHAIFTSDVPLAGPRSPNDLILVAIAAVAAVVMILLAKVLAARE